jgi:hypothetical protein
MASMENAVAPQPTSASTSSMVGAAGIAGAGLFASIGSAYASKAQGYLQQAGYAMQAKENMRMAGLRADKAVEYAVIQADRKEFQTELESLNYKIQANTLLRSLAKTNAAARARGYANGLTSNSGTSQSLQNTNVANTYRDVGITDLNALVSRVFGLEDSTNILRAGFDQAYFEREASISNANSLLTTGNYAAQSGGILATATLIEGGLGFAKTFPTSGITQKALDLYNGK